MQIRLRDLERNLAGDLQAVYLVSGEETLLVEESCTAIVQAAASRGYAERKVIDEGTATDWQAIQAEAANRSLFAERRVLDLRIPPRGFDRKASDALRRYVANPFDDVLLLIRTGRLEARQRSAAWFKAIDAAGAVLLVWPLTARELPGWLTSRCRTAGIEVTRDAIALLADRVEGNLLAGAQEIEKLKLAGVKSPVDAETLRAAVEDASHFNAFELIDAAFDGQPARVRKMVRVLRQEGAPVFMVLGAVNSQLRNALRLAHGARVYLPPQRARALRRLGHRLGADGLEHALSECALLDMQAKGALRGDAWQSLERVLVRLAGGRTRTLAGEADHLRYPMR